MTKPTGRPRGRPRKHPIPTTSHVEIANRKLVEAGEAKPLFGVTEAEVKGITPLQVMQLVLEQAVLAGDLRLAREAARDAAPYVHARKSETLSIAPEDLKRAADLARLEASRRGFDGEAAGRHDPGALPN